MLSCEINLCLTADDRLDIPAIREATRRISTTFGFGNPSLEGIRFRFTEIDSNRVCLRVCTLPSNVKQHEREAAVRIVSQAGSLLSALLHGKYRVEMQLRESGNKPNTGTDELAI